MKINYLQATRVLAALLSPVVVVSCADRFDDPEIVIAGDRTAFEFAASIEQDNSSRADESGFADGDRFGAFVVNYDSGSPGILAVTDNQANNVAVTFDAASATWSTATDIYWRDGSTPVDVYGYYPFNNALADVETYSFEVRADQSIPATDSGDMSAYEASDFLWAKSAHVAPGTRINLVFTHRLAGVKVLLQKGAGFTDEEWAKLPRIVTVDNTLRSATVNLSTGVATATGTADRHVVMNPDAADSYRAVVVPQKVAAGKSTIGITIDGVNYTYTRDGGMEYAAGKLHNFTLRIDKKEQSGAYTVTLVGESISPWEADSSSHDFVENSYVVVNCPEPGKLRESLAAAGIDIATVKNLKITGTMNDDDFFFNKIDNSIAVPVFVSLTSINLKDVTIVHNSNDEYGNSREEHSEGVLPDIAFQNMINIQRIILPDNLVKLGTYSLSGIGLTSTLVIPESVREIGYYAISDIPAGGTIVMPSSLEKVDEGAFSSCHAAIDLCFTNNLKYIGNSAFYDTPNIVGSFILPEHIEFLGEGSFGFGESCLDGEITIPSTLTEIPNSAFAGLNLKGGTRLKFHDNISKIKDGAFAGIHFGSHFTLPPNLKEIGDFAFSDCYFIDELRLPSSLQTIGSGAFSSSNFRGHLTIPDNIEILQDQSFAFCELEKVFIGSNVEIIGKRVFKSNYNLQYIEIGKNVVRIGDEAFANCPGIKTIVCLSKEPPALGNNVFEGFDSEHCSLEVTEESVELYRHASGWGNFRRISPHRELVFGFSSQKCLNKGLTRTAILSAEGSWRVKEAPSWIHISPDHSDYKEEVTVTIDPLPFGEGDRSGRIVFELIANGYTADCEIAQYDYEHPEDTEIRLQRASAQGTPVNIFIVGDGFGAEEIVNGNYLSRVEETVEHLFSIEPYKSYRTHFNISTAIAMSPDNIVATLQNRRLDRLNTFGVELEVPVVTDYVTSVSGDISYSNLDDALIVVISNMDAFDGKSYLADTGYSIACVALPDGVYPYDYRGLVQYYAGGAAFAGLGEEYVTHMEHIKGCTCGLCNKLAEYYRMKSKGLLDNITLSSKMNEAPWREFIFHPKYSQIVDIWEGGYNHLRGVWRSEPQSVMSTYIPYYNTISRYAIYKGIMRRAGLTPSLDDFIAKDKIEIPQ